MPADWRVVEAYLELDRAWDARERQIALMELDESEAAKLRRETRGERPDVTLAALAAMRIVQRDGAQTLQAAEFLVAHTGASPTREENIRLGFETLTSLIGADWPRIPQHRSKVAVWLDAMQAIEASEASALEKHVLRVQLGQRPEMFRACAAALAILDQGTANPHLLDAAEFLLTEANGELGADLLLSRAATAVSVHFSHYGDWASMFEHMAQVEPPRGKVDEFLRRMAERAPDPETRTRALEVLESSR